MTFNQLINLNILHMKKLIFILVAFMAISTTAQTIPSHPTVKLTKLATGLDTDDVLTIGADKKVKKVAKSSLVPDMGKYIDTIANQTILGIKKFTDKGIFGGVSINGNLGWGNAMNISIGSADTMPLLNGSAYSNIAIGRLAMAEMDGGNSNIAIGGTSLAKAKGIAGDNTAIGLAAMSESLGVRDNVVVGNYALNYNITGHINTAIGSNSGAWKGNSNNSVFVGGFSTPLAANQTNQIVIGAFTTGAGSNTATIGNTNITLTRLRGQVNMGSIKIDAMNTAPASATDMGTEGEVRITSDYVYVCTATNTWVRTALTTW